MIEPPPHAGLAVDAEELEQLVATLEQNAPRADRVRHPGATPYRELRRLDDITSIM